MTVLCLLEATRAMFVLRNVAVDMAGEYGCSSSPFDLIHALLEHVEPLLKGGHALLKLGSHLFDDLLLDKSKGPGEMLFLELSSLLLLSDKLAKIVRSLLEARLQSRCVHVHDVANLAHIVLKMVHVVVFLAFLGHYDEERVFLIGHTISFVSLVFIRVFPLNVIDVLRQQRQLHLA